METITFFFVFKIKYSEGSKIESEKVMAGGRIATAGMRSVACQNLCILRESWVAAFGRPVIACQKLWSVRRSWVAMIFMSMIASQNLLMVVSGEAM